MKKKYLREQFSFFADQDERTNKLTKEQMKTYKTEMPAGLKIAERGENSLGGIEIST